MRSFNARFLFALAIELAILLFAGWIAYSGWSPAKSLEFGTFIVLTLTLVALVWYAYDTNSIARITLERWKRDAVLGTTYQMVITDKKGEAGKTLFQLQNTSTVIVWARVACNFRLYGESVEYHPMYAGKQRWVLFPQQLSQGWFAIEPLLQKKGKTIEQMIKEYTETNWRDQLQMFLELEFWDENEIHRKLPGRLHYFDFNRWNWIPELGEQPNTI